MYKETIMTTYYVPTFKKKRLGIGLIKVYIYLLFTDLCEQINIWKKSSNASIVRSYLQRCKLVCINLIYFSVEGGGGVHCTLYSVARPCIN